MKCKLCLEHYRKYPLKDGFHVYSCNHNSHAKSCAFSDGVFNSDNWGCQSLNVLRDICEVKGVNYFGDDNHLSSVYSSELGMFLILFYYKNRGTIDKAWLEDEDDKLQLTLDFAEKIIDEFSEVMEV